MRRRARSLLIMRICRCNGYGSWATSCRPSTRFRNKITECGGAETADVLLSKGIGVDNLVGSLYVFVRQAGRLEGCDQGRIDRESGRLALQTRGGQHALCNEQILAASMIYVPVWQLESLAMINYAIN